MATRGRVHPDFRLGFEVVSSTLLDGLADRMGQFASGTAPEMKEQARVLLSLHIDVDREYLDRRIKEETSGDPGIADV